MRTEVVTPYVEKVCRQVLEEDELPRDDDGCIRVTMDHTTAYIRVDDGPADTPRVMVLADLRKQVESSPELLARMNEANARSPYVRLVLVKGTLTALTEVVAESLQPLDLRNALGLLEATAEHLEELVGVAAAAVEEIPSGSSNGGVGRSAGEPDEPSIDLGNSMASPASVDAPEMAAPVDPAAMDLVNRQLGYL